MPDMGDRLNATEEERRIYGQYTADKMPFAEEVGVDPPYKVWLVVGHQRFAIHFKGSALGAEYMRWMLAKALASFLQMESGKD